MYVPLTFPSFKVAEIVSLAHLPVGRSIQTELPILDTRLSKQVHIILAQRRKENGGRVTKLLIARQNFDAAEIEFADMLIEDHNNAALAYPDCTSSALARSIPSHSLSAP